jgi:hypothetical protein
MDCGVCTHYDVRHCGSQLQSLKRYAAHIDASMRAESATIQVARNRKESPVRLDGKVAIITGAGSGMGRAMANLFAAEGAKLVVGEWNAATLEEVVAEVKAAGGEIVGVQGNVADQADDQKIIDAAVNTYGRIDILCNNAGVMDLFAGVAEMDASSSRS